MASHHVGQTRTIASFVLCLACFVLGACFEAAGRVFVNARLIETVCESFRSHFLALNVDAHSRVDVEDGRVRTERPPLWHQAVT